MLRRPFHKMNLKIYLAHIRGNFYDGAIQAAVVDQWCLILGKRGVCSEKHITFVV